MNLGEKDRLREAFLLGVYEALGSHSGPDGTLKRIAIEQAAAIGIEADERDVVTETVTYWRQRGYLQRITQQLGGGLSPRGVDHVEKLLRDRKVGRSEEPRPQTLKREVAFGDWIRGEPIDEGGGGWIFKAYHKTDAAQSNPHAIKILKSPKPRRAARFRNEIEAGVRLTHPNILRVLAHDLGAERAYYVAPYYERGHLSVEHVRVLSHAERMRLFATICRAVGYAHANGVAHRDLKPQNILLKSDGSPIVADFGLCFFMGDEDGDERPTASQEQVGSRFYMAPEMADGPVEKVTARADVYSLGKLCYWIFAGTIFDREKLRHPKFDLTTTEPFAFHAHIYQLLERTILEKPEDRLDDANAVAEMAEQLAERIAMDAHVLDLNVPQRCDFCKAGDYVIRVDPQWWTGSFRPGEGTGNALEHARSVCQDYGLVANSSRPWLVLQCPQCGHVQVFQLFNRPDPARNWILKK